jgi:hypothetical protein
MVTRFTTRVDVAGRSFAFELCSRPIALGIAGPVAYFWMDSRRLRRGGGGPNFRPCVDLWWAAACAAGDGDSPPNQTALFFAECFPLVNAARTLQDVYLDAHLRPAAGREPADGAAAGGPAPAYSLPSDETERLRQLAHRGDTDAIRRELESLFGATDPYPDDRPTRAEALAVWVTQARLALRRDGHDGLRAFVTGVVKPWMDNLRRRGGRDRERAFLNRFAYEAKASFYLTYANAWVALIPRLRQERGLDAVGERLLRLWHHQNQPVRDPAAPTGWRPDVFHGQVLALHPLSGLMMSDPAHRQALGAWLTHPDHDGLVAGGRVHQCPAYRDVVAAILTAAHEYRHAHARETKTRRGLRPGGGTGVSVAEAFEAYAATRGLRCPGCDGPLAYDRHDPPAPEMDEVLVRLRCARCATPATLPLRAADLGPS